MHAFVNNRMTEVLIFLHRPRVRSIVQRVPIAGRVYAGYRRKHPFDREFGTDTGGFKAAGTEEAGEGGTEPSGLFYIGSQPSIVRTVLSLIPHPEQKHLIDIGCGKGRVLLCAGQMPFRSITGIEIDADLVRVAQRNLATMHPSGSEKRIHAVHQDVGEYQWPPGDIVVFNYHSLGKPLLEAVVSRLREREMKGGSTYFIYYNPVWADVLDGESWLTRWYAETLPYSRSEIGYGTDVDDAVVIWSSDGVDTLSDQRRRREVVEVLPGLRVVLK